MTGTKSVLITDLDNTLFDWVDLWYNCFSPMLEKILEISGVARERLIPEIRAVHQRHGTSEYSFLIEELPSLAGVLKGRRAIDVFSSAVDVYRERRKQYLKLYPTVAETLLKLKGKGVRIIAYTESMAFYSNYRLRRLGLDGVIEILFSPEDHVLPHGLSPDELRKYPAEHYDFRYTRQKFTPRGSKKPNVIVLESIIAALNIEKTQCVYTGDSLMKDVAMAVDTGVDVAWAKYGIAHKRAEYKLLQDVTHWTPEDVAREQSINEREHVKPTFTLERQFSELFDAFEFTDYRQPDGTK
jgi:FMN phosphatase YigB (HAD superfamily)